MQNIHTAHVEKQHGRQRDLKAELIRRLAECRRQKACLPQQIPHTMTKNTGMVAFKLNSRFCIAAPLISL